jgi:hypothetical protein
MSPSFRFALSFLDSTIPQRRDFVNWKKFLGHGEYVLRVLFGGKAKKFSVLSEPLWLKTLMIRLFTAPG